MLTTKKPEPVSPRAHLGRIARRPGGSPRSFLVVACLAALLLTPGCTPPGPRAALKGERLIQAGKFVSAVSTLEQATRLLPNSPQAWNLLGLAYHGARQADDAAAAYQRALTLDRNLAAARYNLGCLHLDQGNPAAASAELTTYVSLQPNDTNGWMRLASSYWQLRQVDAAERCYARVLQLNPHCAPALNGIGLTLVQRGRYAEALRQFAAAAAEPGGHPPALLNAAITAHQHLKDRPLALQKYREFLAADPHPPAAVEAIANQLQNELTPAPQPTKTQTATATPSTAPSRTTPPESPRPRTASARRETFPPPLRPPTQPPPRTVVPPSVVESRTKSPEPTVTASAPTHPPSPPVRTVATPATNPPPSTRHIETPPPAAPPATSAAPVAVVAQAPQPAPAPSTPSTPSRTTPPPAPASRAPAAGRYHYQNPAKPAAGDRAEAQRRVQQGVDAQERLRAAEALDHFRAAAQADPSLFEAQYDLAVSAHAAGRLPEALTAYEHALALQPDHAKARLNFALALEGSGYLHDAAAELEKIVADHPNDAAAHFSLGSLYASRLRDHVRARTHYQRVLQLEPRHPQATAMRFWLENHP